jgi:hypothetical protein
MGTAKAYVLKTRTENGRIAKTTVFMPEPEIIVINRRILATEEEVKNGWFSGSFPIYCYKNYVLMESEMVFWADSFGRIREAVDELIKLQ